MADKQNDDAFVQAMSITTAQAGVRPMTAQEIVAYAKEVAAGIRQLQGNAVTGATEPAVNPKDAVRETSVVCLECGAKFKMLTKRHLAQHGLTPEEYKAKKTAERNEVFVLTSHGIHPAAKDIHMKTEWLERILATASECGVQCLGFDELK